MAIKSQEQFEPGLGVAPEFESQQDAAAWALLRSLACLGGTVGMRASKARRRWTEDLAPSLDEQGDALIPKSWADGLVKGPAGEKGQALAKALLEGDLARRALDDQERKDAKTRWGNDWPGGGDRLFNEFAGSFSAFSLFHVTHDLTVGSGPQERRAWKKKDLFLAQGLEQGLEQAQVAWNEHQAWPEALAQFRLSEKILDSRQLKLDPEMEQAARAFADWNDGLPKTPAGLAAGRALALAAAGLSEQALDCEDSGELPRWRAARKMMAQAQAEFGVPEYYGASPRSPLAWSPPHWKKRRRDGSDALPFERGDSLQYEWRQANDTKIYSNPLVLARDILRCSTAPSRGVVEDCEGEYFNGEDVGLWASQTLALFDQALLRCSAKADLVSKSSSLRV